MNLNNRMLNIDNKQWRKIKKRKKTDKKKKTLAEAAKFDTDGLGVSVSVMNSIAEKYQSFDL